MPVAHLTPPEETVTIKDVHMFTGEQIHPWLGTMEAMKHLGDWNRGERVARGVCLAVPRPPGGGALWHGNCSLGLAMLIFEPVWVGVGVEAQSPGLRSECKWEVLSEGGSSSRTFNYEGKEWRVWDTRPWEFFEYRETWAMGKEIAAESLNMQEVCKRMK